MSARHELGNFEIGLVTLASPIWIPFVVVFALIWGLGWIVKKVYGVLAPKTLT